MNEDTLEGKVAAITAAVAPLQVRVELQHTNNVFTIYIDGSATFNDPAEWTTQWGGFDNFITALIAKYKINFVGKYCDGLLGEVYLGTLFDMISV